MENKNPNLELPKESTKQEFQAETVFEDVGFEDSKKSEQLATWIDPKDVTQDGSKKNTDFLSGKFDENIILSDDFEPQKKTDKETGKEIKWVLGNGAFGKVYKAKRANYKEKEGEKSEDFAMKILSNYDENFVREVKTLSSLTHPNIIMFYGIDKSLENVIMESVTDGDLTNWLNKREKEEFESLKPLLIEIGFGICKGLQYIHKWGLLHLDLKTDNILMQENVPKISDFGLSVEKTSEKKTKAGTPGYMAPEIIDCEEVLGIKWQNFEIDERCDLFSLSILLFILFHKGKWPYPSELDSIEKLNGAILKNNLRPKFNKNFFSNQLKEEIEKIIKKLKKERKKNSKEAKKIFEKAEKLKSEGKFSQTLELYLKCEKFEYFPAFISLANFYNSHNFGFYDKIKSRNYFNESAKRVENFLDFHSKNDVFQIIALGICYKEGIGIVKNYAKAFQLFKLASIEGNSEAQNNLAICFEDGEGVEKDLNKAFYYFEMASKQGNLQAKYNLACAYKNGEGISKDLNKAFYYFELSANQGNPKAQRNLAYFYKNGEGTSKDLNKAFYYFELSAKQGNSDSQRNLAICYKNSQGILKDLNKAFYYFELAAKQGDSKAQFNLGNCYKNGEGILKDLNKAFYYFELSAKQGNSFARNNLGNFYFNGEVIKKDLSKAFHYFELSAKQGHLGAAGSLENLKKNPDFITFQEKIRKIIPKK